MDTIGNVQTAVIPVTAFFQPAPLTNAVSPDAVQQISASGGQPPNADGSDSDNEATGSGHFTSASVQQKHFDTVQKVAQTIANTHVLGNQDFTIYKDSTGQLITRFRNLNDGKVTYIPQPSLFKIGGSSEAPAVLKIRA